MDLTKLAGIKDWIPLKTVKGVRSFLGFRNFYQRFIGNYVEIAKPLNGRQKFSNGHKNVKQPSKV